MLVAIGVGVNSHWKMIGVAEGMKEDAELRSLFTAWLISYDLTGVYLVVGDRCTVHLIRNVFARVSPKHTR